MALAAGPAAARGLIRDAEIEHTLRRIANPLFRAAGVNPATVEIYIVNDREPNAFVAGGQNIFINTGLLTELGSVDELRAVIAHELGHITGGHLARRDEALRGVRGMAAIGMLGALAAAAAGVPEASVAIATGHGAGGAPQRAGLQPRRGGERRPGRPALPRGRGQRPAGDARRARPLPRPGRAALGRPRRPLRAEPSDVERAHGADRGPGGEAAARAAPSAEDAYWHARMVAKLDAFLGSPAQTLRKYPERDGSEAAALARAIAWHRRPDPARADAAMQALLRGAAGRPLLPRPRGPVPARERARGGGGARPTARRWRWRRRSR